MFDRDEIIRRNPIITVCQDHFGMQFRRNGGELYAPCPLHQDGKRPNFRVNVEKQTWFCDVCGVGGSVLDLVMKKQGLTFEKAAEWLGARPIEDRDSTPTRVSNGSKPIEVAAYDYQDENGSLLYQVVRFVPKTFRQRHQAPDGSWIWNMEGVRRVLYRLPQIKEAQAVFIVEGEKDADNLWKIGLAATCNVGGAGKWLESYSADLKGKQVIIWPDRDDAGRKHAELVQKSLAGIAAAVFRFEVEDKDASDFITRLGAEAAQKSIADQLATLKPINPCPDIPIKTIDELETDYIEFQKQADLRGLNLGKWLPSLGHHCRQLVPGEVAVFVSDTGVGKTAILQNLAVWSYPIPTLMFEMELPGSLMFERFVQIHERIESRSVWDEYKQGTPPQWRITNRLRHVFTVTVSKMNLVEMERIINAAEIKMGVRPALVMVDYVQLVHAPGTSRYERASNVAEGLKVLAKSCNVILIATSQIHRPMKEKEGREITLHDAKDSGSIENSAGLVIGAWREGERGEFLTMRILKNTKGFSGMPIFCNFNGPTMEITEKSNDPEPG